MISSRILRNSINIHTTRPFDLWTAYVSCLVSHGENINILKSSHPIIFFLVQIHKVANRLQPSYGYRGVIVDYKGYHWVIEKIPMPMPNKSIFITLCNMRYMHTIYVVFIPNIIIDRHGHFQRCTLRGRYRIRNHTLTKLTWNNCARVSAIRCSYPLSTDKEASTEYLRSEHGTWPTLNSRNSMSNEHCQCYKYMHLGTPWRRRVRSPS